MATKQNRPAKKLSDRTDTFGVIANALRLIALRSQKAFESGRASYAIDRGDLEETLLALADELEAMTR